MGAGRYETRDDTNQPPPKGRPTAIVVAWFMAPLIAGSIGGGAERAAATMSRVSQSASVLIESGEHADRWSTGRQSAAATNPGWLPSSIPASGPYECFNITRSRSLATARREATVRSGMPSA